MEKILKTKKGFEFSFAWIFAVLVGAIIIIFAVYATVKFIETSRYQIDTVTAKQLSIIFEPMETELASGKSNIANLQDETRIYDECFEDGNFGKQTFSLSSKLGIGKKWSEKGGDVPVTNKYIFSDDIEEGKTLYFFSKPFKMPWKISEIIFLNSKKYCFINSPEEIEDEVLGLNLQNIKIGNCSENEIEVCFDSGNCEINVQGSCSGYGCESKYDYGFVEKNEQVVFYTGSLMYGAIFSSKEIYECNVKRLMKRLVQQALLFKEESGFLSLKCNTLSISGLLQIVDIANTDNSDDLLLVRQLAQELENQNEAAECKLW